MLDGSNKTIVKARTNKKIACVYINDQCIFIRYIYRGVHVRNEHIGRMEMDTRIFALKRILRFN